jgi:rod shape-determining protein MreC
MSGWLIINHNKYISASFFNSSNAFAGTIYENKQGIENYFRLKNINERLATENEQLRNSLSNKIESIDSNRSFIPSALAGQYDYSTAKVVNNSVDRFRNYFTLNKGTKQGVEEGQGVVNGYGLVGKIKSVSNNFSVGYSALHSKLLISAVIEDTKTLCTANWNGSNPTSINLDYVPRHVKLKKGMSIVSSGYNAVFPPGIKIGEISDISIDADATFYEIKVALAVDFQSLDYVYVIGNKMQIEKDSLENIILGAND